MASFPVVNNPPAKAPQKPAKSQGGISVLCPNWLTTSGLVSEFAASANIPDVASGEPSGSILKDLSYFLLNATFYTHTRKAKVTVLIDTGAAGNFMNRTLARSMDLTCLGPKELLGATDSQPWMIYYFLSSLEWVGNAGIRPENELHFSLGGSSGVLSLLKPGVEPPKSCLSLKASPEVPSPVLIPGILAPYQDAFDLSLATALPQHIHHDVTFWTTVDLVKIDAPMYPFSEHEDKALGVWLDNMLVKGWIVKMPSSVSLPAVFVEKSDRTLPLVWITPSLTI
ncbi:hypothetical protein DSO57_1025970 [Entomophthora muscae]|uniref:Uncharacterized protein n=1 Tax=Entomophthora muscae TaxID=34485 RepID=A0ACC2TDC2_9FUNG|nr:hypothetical protein DSO57_1025970 [Entomophthora muscae]